MLLPWIFPKSSFFFASFLSFCFPFVFLFLFHRYSSTEILEEFVIITDSRQIGTQEHPLLLLALRRLDPAITWTDIHMRMPLPGRVSGLGAFEASIYRCFSLPFSLISWHYTGLGRGNGDYWADERRSMIRSQLPHNAELMNSTRGYAPGLIDPMKGEVAENHIP